MNVKKVLEAWNRTIHPTEWCFGDGSAAFFRVGRARTSSSAAAAAATGSAFAAALTSGAYVTSFS